MNVQNISEKQINADGSFDVSIINPSTTSLIIFQPKLRSLPDNLPQGLSKLDLGGCEKLESLPDYLPQGLTRLDLTSCRSLKSLPDNLPKNLTELDLSHCKSLEYLPHNLPERLTKLNLVYCAKLESLPDNLPQGLTKLDLGGCEKLESLPDYLPQGLTRLNLVYCAKLESLPDNLPRGLTELDLSGCDKLEFLPDDLPWGLTKLALRCCEKLESLPDNLPRGLTELDLSGCKKLESLPNNLPKGLTRLDLYGCQNLIITSKLISQLKALEENGCEIKYPRHLNLNNQAAFAKQKLEEIITKYNETNERKDFEHIKTITHRFLSEGIGARGGIKAIAATIFPILEELEKNPNHLLWIDEISEIYLTNCINQPVAGFAEISGWMDVAKAKKISDKFEAARYPLAIVSLLTFIKKLPPQNAQGAPNHQLLQQPGERTEAEAANAFLREVHKELLKNGEIKKPWPGIAEKIAYEGTITQWIQTPSLIEKAVAFVKENALNATQDDILSFLLEGSGRKTWQKMIISKEDYKKIEENFKRKYNILELFCQSKNPEEAEYLEGDDLQYLKKLEEGSAPKIECDYYKELTLLAELNQETLAGELILEKETALSKLAKKITDEEMKKRKLPATPSVQEDRKERVDRLFKKLLEKFEEKSQAKQAEELGFSPRTRESRALAEERVHGLQWQI